MNDYFHDFDELPPDGMHASAQGWGKYQLGLGARFPLITVFIETLPHGLIADEL